MSKRHGILEGVTAKKSKPVRMSVNLTALENALLQKSVRFSGHFQELSELYEFAKNCADTGNPFIFKGTIIKKGEVKTFFFKTHPVPGLTHIGTQLMDLVL